MYNIHILTPTLSYRQGLPFEGINLKVTIQLGRAYANAQWTYTDMPRTSKEQQCRLHCNDSQSSIGTIPDWAWLWKPSIIVIRMAHANRINEVANHAKKYTARKWHISLYHESISTCGSHSNCSPLRSCDESSLDTGANNRHPLKCNPLALSIFASWN